MLPNPCLGGDDVIRRDIIICEPQRTAGRAGSHLKETGDARDRIWRAGGGRARGRRGASTSDALQWPFYSITVSNQFYGTAKPSSNLGTMLSSVQPRLGGETLFTAQHRKYQIEWGLVPLKGAAHALIVVRTSRREFPGLACACVAGRGEIEIQLSEMNKVN
ncbi:hypothetical protein BDW22DRAFT_884610 [Trametopsis cervina]|nr:hypothetical protein BDW22DRAFT_884610 [Trametopsis cervina]